MTMPASASTLDVIATSNSNNIYASRILVQVDMRTVAGAPTSLSATPGDTTVGLSWTAPASDGGAAITNYKIYRDTSASPTTLLDTIGNLTTYTDNAVSNGTLYYYRVKATNAVGDSAYSSDASATPEPAAPPPPSTQSTMRLIGGFMRFVGGRILFH